MKRYVVLFSAVVMQMCLGATYSWSVFVQPLREFTGLAQGPVQLPFSCFYFTFPLTMIVSGSLLGRFGPRRSAMVGAAAFGGGWILASLGPFHFSLTVAGIGFLAGIGVGFAYIVPIAVCVQWFPRNPGLVTGIAVAGFGGGAALVSLAGGYLLDTAGLSPFVVFRYLGMAFLLLVTTAALAMEYPRGSLHGPQRALPVRDIIGRPGFALLYLAMLSGLAAGFSVVANLRELCPGSPLRTGVLAVSLFALSNFLGRVLWGTLFDRIRPDTAIALNLAAQSAVLISAPFILDANRGLLAFAFLTGLNYGGVLVLYASAATRIWGGQAVGQVYPWLFSSNVPAAAAPLAVGLLYDTSGSFTVSLWALGFILLVVASLVRWGWNTALGDQI